MAALQTVIDGLLAGSAYALLALGFTLIFGVLRRLNLSYGPTIMAGVYAGTFLHLRYGAGLAVATVAAVAVAALVGLYVERLCFAPLRRSAAVASMVASFAIWMQIEEAVVFVLPRHAYAFPGLSVAEPLAIGSLLLRTDHLILLVAAAGLVALLYATLHLSRFGLAVRAVIDSPTGAGLMGIPVATTTAAAFVLASALGGTAGVLIAAAEQQVTPMIGMWATMKGLIAMMLGGLGSLPGAMAGGLLLGVVEAFGQWFFGPQGRDLVAYLLLFVLLAARPNGLFGALPANPMSARG